MPVFPFDGARCASMADRVVNAPEEGQAAQDGSGVGGELERIAVTARDNGATAAPLLRSHSCGQEVVRLISRRLRISEPTLRH